MHKQADNSFRDGFAHESIEITDNGTTLVKSSKISVIKKVTAGERWNVCNANRKYDSMRIRNDK